MAALAPSPSCHNLSKGSFLQGGSSLPTESWAQAAAPVQLRPDLGPPTAASREGEGAGIGKDPQGLTTCEYAASQEGEGTLPAHPHPIHCMDL